MPPPAGVGTVGGVCVGSVVSSISRAAADAVAVTRMTDTMAARWPDGSGLGAGPVALGHRRLKVIDLSERAAQPMVDADLGVTIAFNGCIYNHHDLRRELEGAGYRFFSMGDTEVIVKAYRHWGDSFVEHLTGMFAFCLVERDSGRLVLGRDGSWHQAALPGRRGGKLFERRRRPPCSPAAASIRRSTPWRCTTT